MTRLLVPALAVVLMAGCSTVESADIRTSGIDGNIVVSVPEGSRDAKVSASLNVGTLTFVELGDGEQLTAEGAGRSTVLRRKKIAGTTGYHGLLEGVSDPGTEVVVALSRDGENTSAPRSVVRLPDPVRLEAP